MLLETPNLQIRHVVEADLPFIIALREDVDLRRYTSWPRDDVDLHEWARALVKRALTRGPGDGPFPYIMMDKASGAYAGELTIMFHEPQPNQAELGYSLTHGYHGRGLVVEGLAALIPHLIENFALNSFTAQADTRNIASCKILEKLGFSLESLVEKAYFKQGEQSDKYVYTLPVSEWKWPR